MYVWIHVVSSQMETMHGKKGAIMAKSAQVMTDKFKAGIAGGQKAYTEGVQNTDKDPAQLAIAAKDKWQAKLQEAFAEGSFEKGLAAVPKAAWQQATIAGASKYTQSAANAATKYSKYATVVAPMQGANQKVIDSMPSASDADNDARMLANVNFQRSLKGIMRGRR